MLLNRLFMSITKKFRVYKLKMYKSLTLNIKNHDFLVKINSIHGISSKNLNLFHQ